MATVWMYILFSRALNVCLLMLSFDANHESRSATGAPPPILDNNIQGLVRLDTPPARIGTLGQFWAIFIFKLLKKGVVVFVKLELEPSFYLVQQFQMNVSFNI